MINEVKPLLVIDLKKRRIRIHKITLKMLNNPEYIQILINPGDRVLAVIASQGNDHLSHRINYKKLESYCYELYSYELISTIQAVIPQLKGNASYKFSGELLAEHHLVKFPLDDFQQINIQHDNKEL